MAHLCRTRRALLEGGGGSGEPTHRAAIRRPRPDAAMRGVRAHGRVVLLVVRGRVHVDGAIILGGAKRDEVLNVERRTFDWRVAGDKTKYVLNSTESKPCTVAVLSC